MRTISEYDKGPCCRSRRAELEDLNDSRAGMDEGLISLLPEGLSNVGALFPAKPLVQFLAQPMQMQNIGGRIV